MALPAAAASGRYIAIPRAPPVSGATIARFAILTTPDNVVRQASPTLNLSSNNPFRNRLSANAPSPRIANPAQQQYGFPSMSKNPFLDPGEGGAKSNTTTTSSNDVALADDVFVSTTFADDTMAYVKVIGK